MAHAFSAPLLITSAACTRPPGASEYFSPLFCAAAKGSGEIVTALLNKGSDPNQADVDGDRPLHVAARAANAPAKFAVDALLKGGANPAVTNAAGQRPIDVVGTGLGRLDVLSLLQEAMNRTSAGEAEPTGGQGSRRHTTL